MPLDAICLRALTNELKGQLLGARIDKVQQPARDQIVLLLRGNLRLLINAGPNQPRVQLTEVLRENPAEPPLLCREPSCGTPSSPRRRTHHGDRAERTGAHRDVHRPQRERVGRVRHEEAGARGDGPPLKPPAARRGRPHFGLYAPCGV